MKNFGEEISTANAALIAASPCLLAALEKLYHHVAAREDVPMYVLAQARDAIKKARGEK